MTSCKKATLLSIVIPVYNMEAYLERCVYSILRQQLPSFEVILVNDGSIDKSGEMCDAFTRKDERIQVIHKTNGGLSSARNAGIAVSVGEYIGFVDCDDWVSEDIFSYCVSRAKSFDADIVWVKYVEVFKEKKVVEKKVKEEVYSSSQESLLIYVKEGALHGDFSVCNKIYKKSLFDHVRFEEGMINEDILVNFMLFEQVGVLLKSTKIGYYYFQRDADDTITTAPLKMRDLDLIHMSNRLVTMSELKNERIRYYVKLQRARANFSILAKSAYYGVSETLTNSELLIKELQRDVKKDFVLLMASGMPVSRKILIFLVFLNYKLFSRIIKVYKCVKWLWWKM